MTKTIRCTVYSQKKGRRSLQRTCQCKRKSATDSIKLARAKRHANKTWSATELQSPLPVQRLFHEDNTASTPGERRGRSFTAFTEGRMDWRAFGTATYKEMVDTGALQSLLDVLYAAAKCKSIQKKHNILVSPNQLPLNESGSTALSKMLIAVKYLLNNLDKIGHLVVESKHIGEILDISGELVRRWTANFIYDFGKFTKVGYSKRAPAGVMSDPIARLKMSTWMLHASRASPQGKAVDFIEFVRREFDCQIKERTAHIWLHTLGFRYKVGTAQEIYNDGHQRADVQSALLVYINKMEEIHKQCIIYTGEDMEVEVEGTDLMNKSRIIVSYHDECCSHTTDGERCRWSLTGQGGKMADKSRGAARMVAAYLCADIGLWRQSMAFINPGKNKDDWWNGAKTQEQATSHLQEFDSRFPGMICCDVYDNLSGHNCKAIDALEVNRLNKYPGGKNKLVMRDGTYTDGNGKLRKQSMHFKLGDVLLVPVKINTAISGDIKTSRNYNIRDIVTEESELLGVAKGMIQILEERGREFAAGGCKRERYIAIARTTRNIAFNAWKEDWTSYEKLQALLALPYKYQVVQEAELLPCTCAACVLHDEFDFKNQVSGLEEIYAKHNILHGTNHTCMFLPKFHPELNPIERVWSRMKWYVRKHNTGNLTNLAQIMDCGLSEANLPLSTVRRYVRLMSCYLCAYSEGKDIIQAEEWIRQHRQHRGYAEVMDSRLEQIYYPTSQQLRTEHEELPGESLEELAELLVEYDENGQVNSNRL